MDLMILALLLLLPLLVIAQNDTSAQSATAFALVYGYPLLAWQRDASGVIQDVGINSLQHARELSTPANRSVVKPNVDTLYSTLIYDLSEADLEISIPEVPADNFKLFSFYDPYGVNWANVGTGGYYERGRYLLQRNESAPAGLQVTNGSDYIARLHAPSPYGVFLARNGVNETNEDEIRHYQDSIMAQTVDRPDDGFALQTTPSLRSLISAYDNTSTPATNVLTLLARYEQQDGNNLTEQLQVAGVADGAYQMPSSVNLTVANSTAIARAADAAANSDNLVTLNHGWFVLSPDLIGTFGTNYALRTAIADSGYLALRNPFAVYPTWSNGSEADATSTLAVGADKAILFTFSGKPPLQQAGFWSLTAYGGDFFLITNDIGTYALGDRSNITYPDGAAVYGADADGERDGAFQILMQPADVAPPANWTGNWLPAPSGGGAVVPQLRFFAAEDALSNGDYEYPTLTRIAAIKKQGDDSGNADGSSSGDKSNDSSVPGGTSTGVGVPTQSAIPVGSGVVTAWSLNALLIQFVVQSALLRLLG